MWGFQSSIFDLTNKGQTLDLVSTLPNKVKNDFVYLFNKFLIYSDQAGSISKYRDDKCFNNLDSSDDS